MATGTLPTPAFSTGTTATATGIPQPYINGATRPNDAVSRQQHHSSSVIIAIIIIASAIIVSASVYLLLRCLSRRCNRSLSADDVVSDNRNENEHVRHHVICFGDNGGEADTLPSLPLFTFSSLTGKIAGGDCAVCLSRFEGVDQLRLLPLCCHAFHAQCIDAWLKSNLTCPLCRSPVSFSDADIMNKIASARIAGDGNNSFRIEIGSISRRREPSESGRRSYSIGSYEYVLDEDGYEISFESTLRRDISDCTSVDKDSATPEPPEENLAAEVPPGGDSGRRNWLREYVDRFSGSLSSRTQSFRGSGRFFTGSSRRSDTVGDFEATHGRIGEEISELFRWLSGV